MSVYLSEISVSCLHGGISCPEAHACGCVSCLKQPGDTLRSVSPILDGLDFEPFLGGGRCFYLKCLTAAGRPKHSVRVESKPGRCHGSDGAAELHKLSLPSPAEVVQHTSRHHSLLPPEHQQVPQTLTVKEVVSW